MIVYCVVLVVAISKVNSYITYGGSYKFSSTVEMSDDVSSSVGYQITATAKVFQINQQLLLADLQDVKLHYATTKLPNKNFKESKSSLDSLKNSPFFIKIVNGIVHSVYILSNEESSFISIKKGFASLFQFQIKSTNVPETDTSGTCDVKYEVSDNLHIKKWKDNCQALKERTLWGGNIFSQRISEIEIEDGKKLMSVVSKETHTLKPSFANFDTTIFSKLELIYESDYVSTRTYQTQNTETVISSAEQEYGSKFINHDLLPQNRAKQQRSSQKFSNVVKDNNKDLNDKEFGTKISAEAALNVMLAAKEASYDVLYKALKTKNNKKIRGQLIDILGAVQTTESHKAAKQFLNLTTDNYNLDFCERYLWALSISPIHEKTIIEDLLQLSQGEFSDMKFYETLVQTISSMVKKYSEDTKDNKLLEETLKVFTDNLKKCKKEDELCQRIYLKSFKNIASPKILNIVLEYALNGSKRIGMRAMKAIRSFGPNSWNENVIKIAERILLTNGTYDSSAKTIALDILLETNPSDLQLAKILSILKQKGSSKELKEYLLQRILHISEKNKLFEKQLKLVLSSEGLNNYNYLAQGGLSTAFERRFMENGFLSTTQEVMSGILKQGYVHVNLEENDSTHTIFTLGLFSNGLNSFISSGEDSTDDESVSDSDELNAGLELSVLGVEFRPFIFFEGNGALMGHVFSGTASTMTPAYQAVLLLEDDTLNIDLAIGQPAEVKFSSVASVDLSGKIEISLWSRTADSLVQNRAGLIKRIEAKVSTPFVECGIKHDITVEPQLSLTSYSEFYDKMALCLQLQQPDTLIEYKSKKYENIVGTKQKIRKSKTLKTNFPGKSYALNTKNNEMCNIIYPSSEK